MLEQHEHKDAIHDFDGIKENRVNSPPVYFTVLFYGLVVWGVIFCAFYLFSGWSSEGEFHQKMAAFQERHEQPAPTKQAPAAGAAAKTAEVDAAALYGQHCAACHGTDGQGGIGPDLTDARYRYGREPEAVATSIREGRPDGMPAFAGQLSQAEIEALADYVIDL